VLRSSFSERAERGRPPVIPSLENVLDLYFNGNLDASFAFGGQVAGRIDAVKPVAQIMTRRWPSSTRSCARSPPVTFLRDFAPESGESHATPWWGLLVFARSSRQEDTWRRPARFSGTRSCAGRSRNPHRATQYPRRPRHRRVSCTSRSCARRSRTRRIEIDRHRRGTAMPGVVAVYVLNGDLDLADHHGFVMLPPTMNRPPLARDTVRFVGDIVAMVVAESKPQALDAAEAVIVDYDPLPAVPDMEAALEA
jgi:hypothetical protein